MKDLPKINPGDVKKKVEEIKLEKLIKKSDLEDDRESIIADNSIYEYDLDCLKRKNCSN